jgi:hypothetical protein
MPPRRPDRRRSAFPAALLAPALVLTGCASDPPTVPPSGVDGLEVPTPSPDPDDFVERIDNPWLPLLPGAEWVYESTGGERITVTVTDRTREVAGVTTTVVRDVVTDEDGAVVEETDDWFAQDRDGNVWYFGEDTVEYDEQGRPDDAGSWEAGVDGAEAGIVMLATPRRGDGYQQEQAAGEAEDRATVLDLDGTRQVGSDSYDELLVTEETSPLEPGLAEHKFYARGTGLVLEETVSGGSGEAALVGFTPGEAAR